MKTHTVEELNELKAWFQGQKLPQTMHIDKATFTPDLENTIDMLFEQAYIYNENPKMQGSILLLKKIKAKIEEENMK